MSSEFPDLPEGETNTLLIHSATMTGFCARPKDLVLAWEPSQSPVFSHDEDLSIAQRAQAQRLFNMSSSPPNRQAS